MTRPIRWWTAGCMAVAWLAAGLGAARAAEQSDRFLEGLRDRGYYDVALDYLEAMRTSPIADEEFKQKIDFEAGSILIDSARIGRVTAVREKQLAEAEQRFNRFLSQHADHPLAPGAKTQLANLLVERGRIRNDQAAAPQALDSQKQQWRGEARELFTQAQKVFEALDKQFLAALEKFPKIVDPNDTKTIEQRDTVRRDLLQARLALAAVLYEIAQTHPEGSDARKKALTESAERYRQFHENYSTRLAGLYAKMYEGRAYRELGDHKKAFDCFEELFGQPDSPQPFRVLKNKASVLALETALLPAVKKYAEAVALYRAWESTSQPWENATPEGLGIKYLAAEAALERARTLSKDKPDEAKTRRELLGLAKKLFGEVVRFPSEYQAKARQSAMVPELVGDEYQPPEPTNFAEARDRGKYALDRMSALELEIKLEAEKGNRENVERFRDEIAEQRRDAVKYLNMALGMTDADTSTDDLNVIRYYLSFLYWASDDPYRAATLGEFLARRYPNAPGARQGAKIAMAAYAKLLNEAPEGDRQFESRRMVGIAEFIAERWAGEPDADEAWMTLVRIAVMQRDLDKATEYLGKIPADSPRRGEAELTTGQALWGAYLRAATAPEGQRPPQDELDAMVDRAQSTLEDGIERMRKAVDGGAEISPTLAAAALSLTQISIDAGQPEKAVQWIDDPMVGVMTMVRAKHPATDRGNYRVEAHKSALRAYVATQDLDRAEEVMKALEALTREGGDEEAGKKLTRIYISLGQELQRQLERLRAEGKTEQVKKVSEGFELFLTKISQRQEGNTFNSLNWVAGTFFSLGAGFDTGASRLPPEAQTYYRKAAETYLSILQRGAADSEFIPEGAETAVRVQLAKCFRRLSEYQKALGLLLAVLQERQTVIDAQVEAAYTYQGWGEEKPENYVFAIRGSTRYKDIWGWGTIARRVINVPAYRSTFFEARYNLAVCRFQLALTKQGTERAELLKQAENDIVIVYRLYSDMGGDEWYPKYDELLKTIQKMLGKRPDGLKAAGSAAATASR